MSPQNKSHTRPKAPVSFVSLAMLREVMNRTTWATAASACRRIDALSTTRSFLPKVQPE